MGIAINKICKHRIYINVGQKNQTNKVDYQIFQFRMHYHMQCIYFSGGTTEMKVYNYSHISKKIERQNEPTSKQRWKFDLQVKPNRNDVVSILSLEAVYMVLGKIQYRPNIWHENHKENINLPPTSLAQN